MMSVKPRAASPRRIEACVGEPLADVVTRRGENPFLGVGDLFEALHERADVVKAAGKGTPGRLRSIASSGAFALVLMSTQCSNGRSKGSSGSSSMPLASILPWSAAGALRAEPDGMSCSPPPAARW